MDWLSSTHGCYCVFLLIRCLFTACHSLGLRLSRNPNWLRVQHNCRVNHQTNHSHQISTFPRNPEFGAGHVATRQNPQRPRPSVADFDFHSSTGESQPSLTSSKVSPSHFHFHTSIPSFQSKLYLPVSSALHVLSQSCHQSSICQKLKLQTTIPHSQPVNLQSVQLPHSYLLNFRHHQSSINRKHLPPTSSHPLIIHILFHFFICFPLSPPQSFLKLPAKRLLATKVKSATQSSTLSTMIHHLYSHSPILSNLFISYPQRSTSHQLFHILWSVQFLHNLHNCHFVFLLPVQLLMNFCLVLFRWGLLHPP